MKRFMFVIVGLLISGYCFGEIKDIGSFEYFVDKSGKYNNSVWSSGLEGLLIKDEDGSLFSPEVPVYVAFWLIDEEHYEIIGYGGNPYWDYEGYGGYLRCYWFGDESYTGLKPTEVWIYVDTSGDGLWYDTNTYELIYGEGDYLVKSSNIRIEGVLGGLDFLPVFDYHRVGGVELPDMVIDMNPEELPRVSVISDWEGFSWLDESGHRAIILSGEFSHDPNNPDFVYSWEAFGNNGDYSIELGAMDGLGCRAVIRGAVPEPEMVDLTFRLKVSGPNIKVLLGEISLTLYGDACLAAKAQVGYVAPISDFNSDCVVNLEDYVVMLGEWMMDLRCKE